MSDENAGPMRRLPTANQRQAQESVERTLVVAEQVYFDSIIHIGVGPFVGKISFGVQNAKDSTIQSATTITVPTSVLLDLLTNLRRALSDASMASELAAAHEALRAGLENQAP